MPTNELKRTEYLNLFPKNEEERYLNLPNKNDFKQL